MWQMYNPNPCGRATGDCAVRAIAKALNTDWETAFAMLASNAFAMCDMMSSNSVIGSLLRMNGFVRENLDEPMTFGEYTELYNEGISVLGTGTHVATAIGNILFDAWDSSGELIDYVWYRKED